MNQTTSTRRRTRSIFSNKSNKSQTNPWLSISSTYHWSMKVMKGIGQMPAWEANRENEMLCQIDSGSKINWLFQAEEEIRDRNKRQNERDWCWKRSVQLNEDLDSNRFCNWYLFFLWHKRLFVVTAAVVVTVVNFLIWFNNQMRIRTETWET